MVVILFFFVFIYGEFIEPSFSFFRLKQGHFLSNSLKMKSGTGTFFLSTFVPFCQKYFTPLLSMLILFTSYGLTSTHSAFSG